VAKALLKKSTRLYNEKLGKHDMNIRVVTLNKIISRFSQFLGASVNIERNNLFIRNIVAYVPVCHEVHQVNIIEDEET